MIDHLLFVVKGYIAGQVVPNPVVTFAEIEVAINATNPVLVAQGKRPLSTNNIANFWKNITRNDPNPIWLNASAGRQLHRSRCDRTGCWSLLSIPALASW